MDGAEPSIFFRAPAGRKLGEAHKTMKNTRGEGGGGQTAPCRNRLRDSKEKGLTLTGSLSHSN